MTDPGSGEPAAAPACGDGLIARPARWSFAGDVAERFDAHIERSVPGYRESHDLIVGLSDFFVHDGSRVYDLGCSTGTLLHRIACHDADRAIELVGIEREPDMVAEARRRTDGDARMEIVEADLLEVEFAPCDLVIACYTAQFVRPAVRQLLFDRVHAALNWGGAFVLFEKVRAPDARFQDLVTTLYNDFKLANGFTAEEILNKTTSLKGVLEPFSTQGNRDLLARAGFVDVTTVWKRLCFEGFLAIK